MIGPEDVFREAERLALGARAGETRRRTVISRAYYACYHLALRLARRNGFQFNRAAGAGHHQQLFRYLDSLVRPHGELREVLSDLAILRQRRVHADYNLGRTIFVEDMQDTLHLAQIVQTGLSDASR